ncbi:MAG: hypothetical protein F2868_04610, partial [Actinobacteria bacterium]|nr:hypothetical protein [Actinomycetota bacterium]
MCSSAAHRATRSDGGTGWTVRRMPALLCRLTHLSRATPRPHLHWRPEMAYVPTPDIIIEHDGPVAIVTLNQPDQRNAFSDAMHDGMQEIWTHLAKDRSVRAIVITGAGKAFSAGGNIPGFIRSYEDPIHRAESMRGAQRLLDAMLECPIPMISAVNGPAVGLGCSVATSCDVVLIAESTFMADTHVPIGLVAGDGGAVQWPVLMG